MFYLSVGASISYISKQRTNFSWFCLLHSRACYIGFKQPECIVMFLWLERSLIYISKWFFCLDLVLVAAPACLIGFKPYMRCMMFPEFERPILYFTSLSGSKHYLNILCSSFCLFFLYQNIEASQPMVLFAAPACLPYQVQRENKRDRCFSSLAAPACHIRSKMKRN